MKFTIKRKNILRFIVNFINRFAFKMTQSHRWLLPITHASGSLRRSAMTHYQCQGKVRVTHGQCLQTDNQSHAVLQLNRDGSQRSTGDARF